MRRLALALALALPLLGCGPKTLKARLIHAEKRANEADTALSEAERAMAELEPDRATDRLEAAKEALADPDASYYPEHQMLLDRVKADEKELPKVRAARAKRDLEEAVAKQQKSVQEELADLKEALERARPKEAGRSEARSLEGALEDVAEELEDGKELEGKHSAYARFVAETRRALEQGRKELEALQEKVAFAEGPGEAWLDGKKLFDEAREEKELAKKRELYGEAEQKLRACAAKGKELLSAKPRLEHAVVMVDEVAISAPQLVSRCASQADTAKQALAKTPKPKATSSARKKKR